jgi:hypothetical protein
VNGRAEIWFVSDDRISVSIKTDQETGDIYLRELLEIMVFAALAAGVIANLPKDGRGALCRWLADFAAPTGEDDIPTHVGDLLLVLPDAERGQKGFEGTLTMKGDRPVAKWKPRGFRLFDREVEDYSQTAIMAVLLDLHLGLSPKGQRILAEAANTLGNLGLIGAIRMRNHASVAMWALDQAVDAETEAREADRSANSEVEEDDDD